MMDLKEAKKRGMAIRRQTTYYATDGQCSWIMLSNHDLEYGVVWRKMPKKKKTK